MTDHSSSSDEDLSRLIQQRLASHKTTTGNAPKHAAVALIIVESGFGPDLPGFTVGNKWNKAPALLLTVRASGLRSHSGQWALPGGRLEENESPLEAAIRETREEISLSLDQNDFLGQLDDYVTRSGYNMTPLIFRCNNTDALSPNPEEVAAIHRIPFSELLRDDAPILSYDELDESDSKGDQHPVLRMPIGSEWIAAPTAAVLYQFREVCLLDRETRVAHYDQPRFSWR